MQTVMIYDCCGETPLRFTVLDGDYSHLNGTYINSAVDTQLESARHDELYALLFDDAAGEYRVTWSEDFPTDAVRTGAKVIVCGCLP